MNENKGKDVEKAPQIDELPSSSSGRDHVIDTAYENEDENVVMSDVQVEDTNQSKSKRKKNKQRKKSASTSMDRGPLIPAKNGPGSSTPREAKGMNAEEVGVKMAIVSSTYPDHLFTVDLGKLVVKAVEHEIDTAPDDELYFPNFYDSWFWRGGQVFHCRGQRDQKWLEDKVGSWKPWEDASLKVMAAEELLDLVKVTICVPREHQAAVILSRIAKQNPTLNVKGWRLRVSRNPFHSTIQQDGQVDTLVHVIMERSEVEALKKLDLRPYCGSGRARCFLLTEDTDTEETTVT